MSELSTQLIHHPYQAPDGFVAVAPGVHKASTVIFPNVHALRTQEWIDKSGYTYGLHGTPTTFTLEERIASVEGGSHCVLAPSGLSAKRAFLMLVSSGSPRRQAPGVPVNHSRFTPCWKRSAFSERT